MEKIQKNLAERLKKLRNAYNLTQEELAEKISVCSNTISNIECGNTWPSLEVVVALEEVFDLEPGTIFLGDSHNFISIKDYNKKIEEFAENAKIPEPVSDSYVKAFEKVDYKVSHSK